MLGFAPIKSPSTTSQYLSTLITKFCSICHRLAEIPISHYASPIRPPPTFGSYGGPWGSVENGTNRNVVMSSTHTYSTFKHSIGLPCTVSQHGRQTTDRAIGIGCLCYCISSLTIENNKSAPSIRAIWSFVNGYLLLYATLLHFIYQPV